MAAISTWSTTAASNNSASPDGWPEGMAPSGVNDSARENMSALRTWYEDAEWIDWGDTTAYVGATQFKIAGSDVTARYSVNRRVRVVGSSTGTIYGYISVSAFSTDTTVTVVFDSGSMSSETLTVSLGIVVPGRSMKLVPGLGANTFTGDQTITSTTLTIDPTTGTVAALEIGHTGGTAHASVLDFHTGATATDFDSRVIASGGTGSSGGGGIEITAASFTHGGNAVTGAVSGAGPIHGLAISNHTDADHDISFALGSCLNSTGTTNLKLTSAMVKQIDATWAAGTAAGGLFSGTVANTTTYHCFLIKKDSDGSIDAGFDTSVTAANIPAGYTAFRRVGSIVTDGSANILAFYQIGNYFGWVNRSLDQNGAAGATTRISLTLTVPDGVSVIADYLFAATHSAASFVVSTALEETDNAASATNLTHELSAEGWHASTKLQKKTNTSGQVAYRTDVSGTIIKVFTEGWFDERGQ